MRSGISAKNLSEVYGFIGNSLLKPMTQTPALGLNVDFWEMFPDFEDELVMQCIAQCKEYAAKAMESGEGDVVERVAVEYTRLFIGPPSPAAPPWETLYQNEEVTVGFGEATFEMRRLLREIGLELSNANRQYEDHMGIELLYLSALCRRCAEEEAPCDEEAIKGFIEKHPLRWIDVFHARVEETYPDGYFARLLALAKSIFVLHAKSS